MTPKYLQIYDFSKNKWASLGKSDSIKKQTITLLVLVFLWDLLTIAKLFASLTLQLLRELWVKMLSGETEDLSAYSLTICSWWALWISIMYMQYNYTVSMHSVGLKIDCTVCYPAFTFSRSMASSLPGLNMMRSCRLAMDPARLDKAVRDGEGLIPVMALVTVERSSLWFTAWPLLLLFL